MILVNDYNNTHQEHYDIITKDFTNVPLEECIERDSKRSSPIGKDVIIKIYNKYIKK
jgi:tRNA uridine 5-carbamoylmethylation protein Kti12